MANVRPDDRYRLGIDVGGTFTDLLLVNVRTSAISAKAKVPSTPHDPSEGVLNGIKKICAIANIDMAQVEHILHGTTVATNAVLEGKGVNVGLITTEGHRQILHIDRSFVPGGLAAFIVWNKGPLLAPLEATVEVKERIDAAGRVVRGLDVADLRKQIEVLKREKVEAVTVCLMNAYVNGMHEEAVREVLREEMPNIPVSISSEVLPEMYEYERALTTVANSYIRPTISTYITNLQRAVQGSKLSILRSDGGLSSEDNACRFPVNLLMSGPAGGVTGAMWISDKVGYGNLLTMDVGGTSADVALIEGGVPKRRKETRVGDVTVRAQALDVHTVGAGGGSIAHVPTLTNALRVGPESAGAMPGPACYGKGGTAPTVTDANVVLGYLPSALLGGEFKLDIDAAQKAVSGIAEKLGMNVRDAAKGIVDIVNEKMFGALRLVSVEQGYDPRDFALVSFGGAGSLHANAVAKLMGSWPVLVPPSPGVLCAFGDATTRTRHDCSRSFVREFAEVKAEEILTILSGLGEQAAALLEKDGIGREEQEMTFAADVRYKGQGLTMPLGIEIEKMEREGLLWLASAFDAEHRKQFHFSFDKDHELVNLRAVVESKPAKAEAIKLEKAGGEDAGEARVGKQEVYMEGKMMQAGIYDRRLLKAGHAVEGPAIITEMDSTTLVLSDCKAVVHETGVILINPKPAPAAAPATLSEKRLREKEEKEVEVEVDVVTLDIVENALRSIKIEMDAVLYRTAMSPGIREQHDQFGLVASPTGQMVVGQFGSFIHGLMQSYTKPIEDGDVILLSDPYSCGGAVSHANDWLAVMPIFTAPKTERVEKGCIVQGELVGWAAMFGHVTDIGGKVACSMPNDACTIYEEGVVIPPVRLYQRGVLNEDLLELILHQCRMPIWNKCDLMAIVASVKLARARILELCGRFGVKEYLKALDLMLERNKMAMGELIRTSIPQEELYFEDYVCDDSMGLGPFKICCTMEKLEGGRLRFDFTGTDRQSPGSINFFLNEDMFRMFCGAYMIQVFDPEIVLNDGFYSLLDVVIPEGSLLKPKKPAALSCRTHALGRIFDILTGLLGQRQPEYLCAAGFSSSPHIMYSGRDEGGKWFQYYGIGFGGIPGRPFGDGADGHSLWPSFTNIPNEFMEKYFPVRIERFYTVPNSGGAGLHRGGNGINIVYRFLEDGELSIHDDRWLTSPWGVNGGRPGERSRKILYRGCPLEEIEGGERVVIPSKCDHVKVKKGDVLHYITWGGGGWGDPLMRPVAAVTADVRRGLVTLEGAEEGYGVVVSKEGAVDLTATEAARAARLSAAAAVVKQEVMRGREGEGSRQGVFDFGFRKGMKATQEEIRMLLSRCEEETGLAPPVLPGEGETHCHLDN
ncbi:5-oxoprolinase [Nannochloropsis oceanica]